MALNKILYGDGEADVWGLVQKDIRFEEPILTRIDYECLKLRYVDNLTFKEIGKLVNKNHWRVSEIVHSAEYHLFDVYIHGTSREEYLERKKRRKE